MADRPKSAENNKNIQDEAVGHYIDLADAMKIQTESHYTELPDTGVSVSITADPVVPQNYSNHSYLTMEEPVQTSESIAAPAGSNYVYSDIIQTPLIEHDVKLLSSSGAYINYAQAEVEADSKAQTQTAKAIDGYTLYGDLTDDKGDTPYATYTDDTGDRTYDAYAVEDLPEAPLNKNSYLVEETPTPVPQELNFGTTFTGILISDPMRQLELPPTAHDYDEAVEDEEDVEEFRSSNLLRRSSSSQLRLSNSSSRPLSHVRIEAPGISPYYPSGGSSGENSESSSPRIEPTSEAGKVSPEAGKVSPNLSEAVSNLKSAYVPSNSSAYSNYSNYSNYSDSSNSSSTGSSYTTEAEPGERAVSTGRRSMVNSGGSTSQRSLPSSSLLTTPQAIQETLDSKGSWNERFQTIYDAPDSEAKYDALHRLSMDFLGVAETYGKVIIAELSIPDSEKSIKPINIGGVAGGSKYAVRGLLFKFAVDVPPHFLYGSDEYAQKAAGHELKGLNQWSLDSEGLHFPLMALVRYCGFTLVALSMLPIGNGSLVYGSDDAGRSVHFDDDVIYEKMKNTATNLKLKGHYLVADNTKMIYGPGDIEGHYGTDHLHYVLDFARVYPPAALVQGEVKEKSRCLFRLLRPELVARFKKPLSSDAFTAWGRVNSDEHNAEVREATQYLVDDIIPILAEELRVPKDPLTMTRQFHLHGVNVRYMGLVRRVMYSKAEEPGACNSGNMWLLREMVVRCVKSVLNQKWRELIKKYQRITPDRCIQEAIGIFNALVEPQTTPGSIAFWGKMIRDLLSVKFPLSLIDQEAKLGENGVPVIDLQKLVFGADSSEKHPAWRFVFERLSMLTGIRFSPTVIKDGSFPDFGVLSAGDIVEIRTSVKQMSLVDFAYVMSKALNGLRQLSTSLASRLFQLAIDRMRQAPEISLLVLRRITALKTYIVRTLKRMKWDKTMIKAVAQLVDVALDGAQVMCNNLPSELATDAAVFLYEIHGNSITDRATIIRYLKRAIESDPTNVRPYLEIAKVEASASRPHRSSSVSECIEGTLAVAPNDPLVRLQIGLLILTLSASFFITPDTVFDRQASTIQEVIDHWLFVKQTDPQLFRQIDLHLFNSSRYTNSQQSMSFTALIQVAVVIDCPELNETIKEALHEEFTCLLLRSNHHSKVHWEPSGFDLLASLGPFPHFKRFEMLGSDMTETPPGYETSFAKVLAQCPNLEKLAFTHRLSLTGEFLASITEPQHLQEIILSKVSSVEDGHVEALCEALVAKTKLVNPETPHSPLEVLVLPKSISSSTIARIAGLLGEVTSLRVFSFGSYSDQMPAALEQLGASLEMLAIADCADVTDKDVLEVIARLPNLLIFNGANSPNLSDSAMTKTTSLNSPHPTLEILVSQSGAMYFFSASRARNLKIITSFNKPTSYSVDIVVAEWPSLKYLEYVDGHEVPNGNLLTIVSVARNNMGQAPHVCSSFGASKRAIISCHQVNQGAAQQVNWAFGSGTVVSNKISTFNGGAGSSISWVSQGALRIVHTISQSGITPKIQLNFDGRSRMIMYGHPNSAAAYDVPSNFSINFFGLALTSFMCSLP